MTRTVSPWNARDELVLKTIKELYARDQVMPSIREIGKQLGWRSTSYTTEKLERLVSFGKIRRIPGKARSIVLMEAQ
jgi:SOS-response transcriptional repressor LexA